MQLYACYHIPSIWSMPLGYIYNIPSIYLPILIQIFPHQLTFVLKFCAKLFALLIRGWIQKYVNFRYSNFVFTDNEIKYT